MKISLISILLMLTAYSWGQKQKISNLEFSVLDQSNLWSVLDDFSAVHVYPTDPYSYSKSTWYKIGDETIINNIAYKKLMKSIDPSHLSWSVYGDLRQDGERIYYFDGEHEILLYDFGLNVGDTIESAIYKGISYVSRLDFIRDTILNNTVRKIYYLTEYPAMHPGKYREIWIEGIGSITDGLLRQTMLGVTGGDFWHEYQLLCFKQNETIVYQSKEYQNCYYDIVDATSDLSISPSDFQIYPNPVSGELFIKPNSPVKEPYTLALYSIKGELVKTECMEVGIKLVHLDVGNFKSGTYILQMTSASRKYDVKMIIKE